MIQNERNLLRQALRIHFMSKTVRILFRMDKRNQDALHLALPDGVHMYNQGFFCS